MRFKNRVHAGKLLAEQFRSRNIKNAVIYALPRGGVVVGYEIARALHLPLELVVTRKVGHQYAPEYALCAVTESGESLCGEGANEVDREWLADAMKIEQQEARRRRELYCKGRQTVSPIGKTAIVVDDGIATGLTIRLAAKELKKQGARKVIIAVPVAPRDVVRALEREVDEVVVLDAPEHYLGAVGAYYDSFEQTSDEEVIELLSNS